METKIFRNLELFFSLLNKGKEKFEIKNSMESHWDIFGLRTEVVKDRILLTSWILEQKQCPLLEALQCNKPERFFTIPQRLFCLDNNLFISTLCPPNSDSHKWYQLCQKQRKFLVEVYKGIQS